MYTYWIARQCVMKICCTHRCSYMYETTSFRKGQSIVPWYNKKSRYLREIHVLAFEVWWASYSSVFKTLRSDIVISWGHGFINATKWNLRRILWCLGVLSLSCCGHQRLSVCYATYIHPWNKTSNNYNQCSHGFQAVLLHYAEPNFCQSNFARKRNFSRQAL